ncbi:MAG: GTPase Era [Rickettsiales bacterium]|nr:MAG: GTPase Era [Rickettsiales bacterium]
MIEQNKLKSLSVCIVGKPNAGKSTLMNLLIGQKLSIVTPKVQTTRSIITGIITIDDTQIILFDTPGIFEPKKKLEKAMVRCAWSSLSSADIITLIIDSTVALDDMMETIIKRLSAVGKPIVFLMNKIDTKSKHYMDNMLFIEKMQPSARIFNISALKNKNVDSFLTYLKDSAKNNGWMYEKDDMTNLSSRFLATEITREQLFLQLHQEIPYYLTVEHESWKEQEDGSIKIGQVIIVGREIHKNMVIGKKGAQIKEIGTKARENIQKLIGAKIHLFLFVKVKENWENDLEILHNMGLSFSKNN